MGSLERRYSKSEGMSVSAEMKRLYLVRTPSAYEIEKSDEIVSVVEKNSCFHILNADDKLEDEIEWRHEHTYIHAYNKQ